MKPRFLDKQRIFNRQKAYFASINIFCIIVFCVLLYGCYYYLDNFPQKVAILDWINSTCTLDKIVITNTTYPYSNSYLMIDLFYQTPICEKMVLFETGIAKNCSELTECVDKYFTLNKTYNCFVSPNCTNCDLYPHHHVVINNPNNLYYFIICLVTAVLSFFIWMVYINYYISHKRLLEYTVI